MSILPNSDIRSVDVQIGARAGNTMPSKTFWVDWAAGRVVGWCDGRKAVEQAIYLCLATPRYSCVIYSDRYGAELDRLRGMDADIVPPELRRATSEALSADDRIEKTDSFTSSFDSREGTLYARFRAITRFGDVWGEAVIPNV